MFEIHLSHLKYITGICQEYITSFPILCHILMITSNCNCPTVPIIFRPLN